MSPKTKKQVEIIRNQSKSRIMEVALNLFAHQGFFNTSVSQIAKQANISKGLIYNYFESKEDLLQQIFIDSVMQLKNLVDSEIQKNMDPKIQLKNIIEQTFTLVKENVQFYKLMTTIAIQGIIPSELKETIKNFTKQTEIQLESIFKNLGYKEYRYEALIFSATLDGLGMQYVHNIEIHPIEEIKQFLINKYCR